jgi:hypothetical protein
MNHTPISIKKWAAWAPGVDSPELWRRFFNNEKKISNELKADVSFLPAMKRRRLSPLARAAFFVAEKCITADQQVQTIFCSLRGESQRTFKILQDIANDEDISPTAFSLSVHNAIAGQFTIAFNNQEKSLAIAPGEQGYIAGFIEAAGLLLEKPDKDVLLVIYDEGLPELYRQYCQLHEFPVALAILLSTQGKDRISLQNESLQTESYQHDIDDLLNIVEFFATAKNRTNIVTPNNAWTISRDV